MSNTWNTLVKCGSTQNYTIITTTCLQGRHNSFVPNSPVLLENTQKIAKNPNDTTSANLYFCNLSLAILSLALAFSSLLLALFSLLIATVSLSITSFSFSSATFLDSCTCWILQGQWVQLRIDAYMFCHPTT